VLVGLSQKMRNFEKLEIKVMDEEGKWEGIWNKWRLEIDLYWLKWGFRLNVVESNQSPSCLACSGQNDIGY
jgi:hypothetical protein